RRHLAGDQPLFETMDSRFRAFTTKRAVALARQIAALAEGRRAKFQRTIYHLEPNIKETPGALRDLQTTSWLQSVEPHEGIPGFRPAFGLLAGIRLRLDEMAGRDQNALSFDAQESLSEQPAALMRDYYRHARVVDRAVRQASEACTEKPGTLLGRFHEWRSRLSTNHFTLPRDRAPSASPL